MLTCLLVMYSGMSVSVPGAEIALGILLFLAALASN
jgi:hypothetical protein